MDFGQLLVLSCVLSSLTLLIIGWLIVRNFPRFLRNLPNYSAPNTDELQRMYEQLVAAHPHDTQSQRVRRIINRYAIRQGIVGALTSFGGLLELPLGLLIDLVYSARSTSAMSYFIAQVYGIQDEAQALNVSQMLMLRHKLVTPDQLIMYQEQFAGAAFQRLLRTILLKTVAKVIPGAGAVIGFLVNWSTVQLFGRLADAYYSKNLHALVEQGVGTMSAVVGRKPQPPEPAN
ncbi:MAG: hypothetical protein J0M07_09865 [Anaerolineae bacterium]|uniref:hypothetical protein n=1 Tax=Candidatus Flexifilum breve TaxID=3140694 RepID=UPI001AD308A9|nr:hypothetical protein [Chloroflexota bacterium]MBK9751169.1 hypothetical protein [Chloroflexota bacterium]MBN8635614.1 hypothetical protein [Anaerolineae bacterium]